MCPIFVCGFRDRAWAALHDDALAAAAGALAGVAHVHLALRCAGTEGSGAGGIRRHLLVVAADLADEIVEGVLDVDAGLGGGLDELAAELSGQGLTLCRDPVLDWSLVSGRTGCGETGRGKCTLLGDHALLLQIALVADDDDGEIVLVLDAQDLLLEGHDFFEGLARRYGVDEQEALAGPHVLFPHCRVLLLACCIQDVQQGDLIVDDTLLAVGICDEIRP